MPLSVKNSSDYFPSPSGEGGRRPDEVGVGGEAIDVNFRGTHYGFEQ